MANTKTASPVKVKDGYPDFNALLADLRTRPEVRVVKVDDQGLVEPARQGRAIVMQPRVRIVVTALDLSVPEILRWEQKWEVGGQVPTLRSITGHGTYTDPTGKETRRQITAKLEARGFTVSAGEWTPSDAEAAR